MCSWRGYLNKLNLLSIVLCCIIGQFKTKWDKTLHKILWRFPAQALRMKNVRIWTFLHLPSLVIISVKCLVYPAHFPPSHWLSAIFIFSFTGRPADRLGRVHIRMTFRARAASRYTRIFPPRLWSKKGIKTVGCLYCMQTSQKICA